MKLQRSSLIAVVIVAASSSAASPGQSTQTPTFRTRVDAVTVDVNATDAQGRPVTDLTAEDFEITESGQLQSINSFRRFTIEKMPSDFIPTPITSLDTQEREAARDDVRLIAIFLDDYHTRLGNAMAVRETLARFITRLDPRDMVAVVYPLTPSSLLTFSRDHEGTARAVRKFEGRKYDYTPRYPQEEIYVRLSPPQIEILRNQVVVDALTGLNTVLGSFHDRRKTILMVSEGLVSFLPPRRRPSRDAPPGIRGPASTGSIANLNEMHKLTDLQNRMREIFTAAARSNTSVYTFDPRGLPVTEFDPTEVDSFVDLRFLRESTDSLRLIADETGGRAIVGTNDPEPLLRQMLVDTSGYYLLGYISTEAPRDGKFHEITVRVKRKGIEVPARKGYWQAVSQPTQKRPRVCHTSGREPVPHRTGANPADGRQFMSGPSTTD
jgi:VWFA-related protein